jgi:RimJ/RimL family protein N-acetyltransferase
VASAQRRTELLEGRGELPAAPGWPHEDTAAGMSFLDHGGLVFVVVDDEGRIAGECGTKHPPDPDGMVEIGYGLAAASRGRGLGSAMVSQLLDRLALTPGVRVVEAEVHADNPASWRILEALGFEKVGRPDSRSFQRYRKLVQPVD